MAANNIDMVVLSNTMAGGIVGLVTPGGKYTTLAVLPLVPWAYENLAVDQNGTYLVPFATMFNSAIARIDSRGGVTTIIPAPSVMRLPTAIAVDPRTGNYVVADIPTPIMVSPNGASTTISAAVSNMDPLDMVGDMRASSIVITQLTSLISVDTLSSTMTTIAGGFIDYFPGLAYDRTRDAWVMGEGRGIHVYRVSRSGAVTTLTTLGGGPAHDLEVYGSRNISASTDPTPGSSLVLGFSEPRSPSAFYLAAASLSTSPGIPTPIGTVDLTPDSLFALSQLAPSMFTNFQGFLDARGMALAGIVIPAVPGLRGLRFYVSFITIRGGAVLTIANTQGFTIR